MSRASGRKAAPAAPDATAAGAGKPLFADDDRGAAAVEFAILGPLVLVLFLGTLELARLGFTVHQLDRAASDTARFASVRSAQSDQPASTVALEAHARDLARGLADPPPEFTVRFLPNGSFSPGNRVEVELAYRFVFTLGLLPIPDLELERRTTMPILN